MKCLGEAGPRQNSSVAGNRNTGQANVSKNIFTESRSWEFLAQVGLWHEETRDSEASFQVSPDQPSAMLCLGCRKV